MSIKDYTVLLSPLLVFGAFALYGVVHSMLAGMRAKALARQWLGPMAERWYRLAFNLFAILTLIPVLGLPALLPDRGLYTIPLPWSLLSRSVQLLGVFVMGVGLLQTGLFTFLGLKQLIEPSPSETQSSFSIKGLYRFVRHPLYTAGLVFIWLTPVMSVNILAMNIALTLYLVIGSKFEERRLVGEFGEAYTRYQAHVPMLVPCLRGYKPEETK